MIFGITHFKYLFAAEHAEVVHDIMRDKGFTDLQIRLYTGCPASYYYKTAESEAVNEQT